MSGAVAFVIGLCALSFALGCVLTAVMLRREQAAEPLPEPVVEPVPEPRLDLRWPPEDYTTKPIHRNPVMGFPPPRPAPEPARPALSVVPDPEPDEPSRLDEVRRMHVVRDVPEPVAGGGGARPQAMSQGGEVAVRRTATSVLLEVAAHPEQARPEWARRESAQREQAHPERAHPEQFHPERPQPEPAEREQPQAEESRAEESRAEESRAEESQPESAEREQPHAEQARSEQAHQESVHPASAHPEAVQPEPVHPERRSAAPPVDPPVDRADAEDSRRSHPRTFEAARRESSS